MLHRRLLLSLVLSFSLSTLLLLAISLKTLISLFTYLLMILNFTSPFQALILLQLSHLYHMPLILSTLGSLLINCLLILIKLNTCSLEPNSNVQKLLIPHFLSMVPHLFQFLLLATIGVVFQSDLSFDQHISNVCRSSQGC